jgi:hypothetical protein
MAAVTALKLIVLRESYAVCQMPPFDPLPAWAMAGNFSSVSRSATELSIVCCEQGVPADANADRGWRCRRVAGQLEFSLGGILASLLDPLAQASIPVFVISTFDTDYLLVKAAHFDRAVLSLHQAGHDVQDEHPGELYSAQSSFGR